MAGFLLPRPNDVNGVPFEFHTDTADLLVRKIREKGQRVVTIQVDCDELTAVLWGLQNFDKRYHRV